MESVGVHFDEISNFTHTIRIQGFDNGISVQENETIVFCYKKYCDYTAAILLIIVVVDPYATI